MHRVSLSLGVLWIHEHEYTTNVCPYCLCIVWCAAYLWVIVSVYVCMICDVFVCVCECACDCMCPPYSPTTNIRLHTTILCGCCCIIHWINESTNLVKTLKRFFCACQYKFDTIVEQYLYVVIREWRVWAKSSFLYFNIIFFLLCSEIVPRAVCVQFRFCPTGNLPKYRSAFLFQKTKNYKNKNRSHYLSEEEFWVDLLSKYIHWTWFRVIV